MEHKEASQEVSQPWEHIDISKDIQRAKNISS